MGGSGEAEREVEKQKILFKTETASNFISFAKKLSVRERPQTQGKKDPSEFYGGDKQTGNKYFGRYSTFKNTGRFATVTISGPLGNDLNIVSQLTIED